MPLDRNAKVRIMVFARALMRRTEEGKHYGKVTAMAQDGASCRLLAGGLKRARHVATAASRPIE